MDGNWDVDVIILSWNRVDDTIAAIGSALEQRGVRCRVYVVDQGSEPAKLAKLSAYCAGRQDVELIRLAKNIGVPGGRNIGAGAGHAPIIAALDNDAEFASPDTLRRAVDVLTAEPKLGAIGFRILDYRTGRDDVTSWGYSERDWERRHLEFPTTNFVGAGHAVRRAAFEAVGGYDERLFFLWEELELGLKLLNRGYDIRYVGHIAVRHKVSAEARIGWEGKRFYYAARNRIYIAAKSGDSIARIAQIAAGFLVKGLRRRRPFQALRAVLAGLVLYAGLPRSATERIASRLKPEVMAQVDFLTHSKTYNFWDRLRNAWSTELRDLPLKGLSYLLIEPLVVWCLIGLPLS